MLAGSCLSLLFFITSNVICLQIWPGFCPEVAANVATEADSVFRDYWEFTMRSDPEFATSVGDHRFNDRLNNYTLTHYENTKSALTELRKRAKKLLDTVTSETDARTNLEALVVSIDYKLDLLNIKSYLFPVSYLDGPPLTLLQLLDYVPMSSKKDFRDLVARYNAFPEQVEEVIGLLREGVRTNMVLHESSLKNFENQVSSFISSPAEESMFYEPFLKLSSFVSSEELDDYLKIAADTITNNLNPALQKLSDYVKNEYRQHLRPDFPVTSLPNGPEFYRKMLNFYVSAEVTPQEIHDLGLGEVNRISQEMDTIIRSFGVEDTKQEFNQRLRANASMFYQTADEALSAYTDIIRNQIEPRLPQFFKKIPAAELLIKLVPDQLAGGPVGYYMPASPDGTTKGTFFLDASNLKNLPRYNSVTLALHESEPGHHLQVSFTNEQEGVPMFRKRVQYPMNAAYLEGWALYSEHLGSEMNLYNDKVMLYGHLSESIFRACRLVVDTGLHALGWTRQQAIDYMLENSATAATTLQKEINRYITWPGQACSYKYGEIKIKDLRSKAEDAFGDKFDLKDFHDIILRSIGPMSFVEKQVDGYINAK